MLPRDSADSYGAAGDGEHGADSAAAALAVCSQRPACITIIVGRGKLGCCTRLEPASSEGEPPAHKRGICCRDGTAPKTVQLLKENMSMRLLTRLLAVAVLRLYQRLSHCCRQRILLHRIR